jgi:hypothetical protein
VAAEPACKRHAQERRASKVLGLPDIDADDLFGHEGPARFLERFPGDGCGKSFVPLEVSRWLVQHDAAAGPLLDEQELTVALDHGGNGDIGLPDHVPQYSCGRGGIRACGHGSDAAYVRSRDQRQKSTAVARISGWIRLPAQTSSK